MGTRYWQLLRRLVRVRLSKYWTWVEFFVSIMELKKDSYDEIKIYLDPSEQGRKKEQRKFQLNAIQIPRLRLLGFCGICFFILIHNAFIRGSISWLHFSSFTAILIGYALISWQILYFLFLRLKSIDLGLFSLPLISLFSYWLFITLVVIEVGYFFCWCFGLLINRILLSKKPFFSPIYRSFAIFCCSGI